jgi:hypothetical protein
VILVGKTIILKKLDSGASICVDLDDLLDMMEKAATEKSVDVNTATVEQKREVLKSMGYEPYFEILKKEKQRVVFGTACFIQKWLKAMMFTLSFWLIRQET